jgi:hypothetical protein
MKGALLLDFLKMYLAIYINYTFIYIHVNKKYVDISAVINLQPIGDITCPNRISRYADIRMYDNFLSC